MSAYISSELRRRVRDFFSEHCAYCHTAERLTVVTFEVDHITPESVGGPTSFDNLCLACPMCNRLKGDRTSAADPLTGEVVSLFHPHQDIWSEHFAWNGEASQLIALTAIARATIVLLRLNRPHFVRVRRLWTVLGEHPPSIGR